MGLGGDFPHKPILPKGTFAKAAQTMLRSQGTKQCEIQDVSICGQTGRCREGMVKGKGPW